MSLRSTLHVAGTFSSQPATTTTLEILCSFNHVAIVVGVLHAADQFSFIATDGVAVSAFAFSARRLKSALKSKSESGS